jgi:hypothetical protein
MPIPNPVLYQTRRQEDTETQGQGDDTHKNTRRLCDRLRRLLHHCEPPQAGVAISSNKHTPSRCVCCHKVNPRPRPPSAEFAGLSSEFAHKANDIMYASCNVCIIGHEGGGYVLSWIGYA